MGDETFKYAQRLTAWLPVVLYTLLIFFLSSRPYTDYFHSLEDRSYGLFEEYLQYPAHAGEYAVLAALWFRALRRQRIAQVNFAKFTLGAVLLTALADESIQYLVPTRSFAIKDLCMDLLGGVLVVSFLLNGRVKDREKMESRNSDRAASLAP